MATIITNKRQLDKILESKATMALMQTRDAVNEAIQDSINEYYKEKVFRGGTSNQPLIYDRLYHLLNSLVKTDIEKHGNTLQCVVEIDPNYLSYVYPGGATGREILEWNEEDGSHGKTVDGDWQIWKQAFETLSGESGIMRIFEMNLVKYGIPIK